MSNSPNGVSLRSSLILLAMAFLASVLAAALVFSDLWVRHNVSFSGRLDSEIPFENTFALLTHFYQGGIQLFNRYDQMSYAYSHLSSGLYTFANLVTAGVYVILSPFVDRPAEFYHHLYSAAFHAVNVFIRTAGGFLLLQFFCRNRWVIVIALIYLNTLLSSPLYNGLLTNNLYSYLPLLLYFILKFARDIRLSYFLAALLTMVLAVANSPLFALGYFYQAVHFFLVGAAVYALFCRRGIISARLREIRRAGLSASALIRIVLTLMACVLLILPSLFFYQSLRKDFHIADSGVGGTTGRLTASFGPAGYFHRRDNDTMARPADLPLKSVDFLENHWSFTWPFLGATTLLLSLLGAVMSRNPLRHIFLWTVLMIVLANTPRDPYAWSSPAHWINALTNPFHVLLRSFHMTALLMPFFFLPLIALGLSAMMELVRRPQEGNPDGKRLLWAMAAVIGIMSVWSLVLPFGLQQYALGYGLVFLMFLVWAYQTHRQPQSLAVMGWCRTGIVMIFLCLFVGDLAAQSYYVRRDPGARTILPRTYRGLADSDPVIPDY